MSFSNPSYPNLADFYTFVINQGVPTADLASNSPYLQWAYNYAIAVCMPAPATMDSILYVLAVYNLGMHRLLMVAQDQPGQTFFTDARATYKLLVFTPGFVNSASDQGTSGGLITPDWMKEASIQTLNLIKTPWGQFYLDYAQSYGPNICDVS